MTTVEIASARRTLFAKKVPLLSGRFYATPPLLLGDGGGVTKPCPRARGGRAEKIAYAIFDGPPPPGPWARLCDVNLILTYIYHEPEHHPRGIMSRSSGELGVEASQA